MEKLGIMALVTYREPLNILHKRVENNREIEFYESMNKKEDIKEDSVDDEVSQSETGIPIAHKQNKEVLQKLLHLLSSNIE